MYNFIDEKFYSYLFSYLNCPILGYFLGSPLVVQRSRHGVERGTDGLGAVPYEQQLGQPLLCALGREASLGVRVPAVLHRLLQGADSLKQDRWSEITGVNGGICLVLLFNVSDAECLIKRVLILGSSIGYYFTRIAEHEIQKFLIFRCWTKVLPTTLWFRWIWATVKWAWFTIEDVSS